MSLTQKHVDIASKYLNCRMSGDVKGCLEAVTDDIQFYSQRDGKFRGKKEFEKYLRTHKPEGKWGKPYIEGNHVRADGTIKILFVPVAVKIIATFDGEKIKFATATKK